MHRTNPLAHNWLIKRAVNRLVQCHLPGMTGVVYDLGCGRRPYEAEISTRCASYVGVDWTNTLHGLRADVVADLNRPLPIESEVADTVVTFEVLEHLSEPQLMLSEACRILRPGGSLFLSVPFQWLVHEAPWDFFRYTNYGLEHLLKKAGFEDIAITPTTGFWSMWILKLNYQLVRLARGPKFVRWPIRALLAPLWAIDQVIALALDRVNPGVGESAGFFVVAHKPVA
jgi:SAM-dependent methyltransferase